MLILRWIIERPGTIIEISRFIFLSYRQIWHLVSVSINSCCHKVFQFWIEILRTPFIVPIELYDYLYMYYSYIWSLEEAIKHSYIIKKCSHSYVLLSVLLWSETVMGDSSNLRCFYAILDLMTLIEMTTVKRIIDSKPTTAIIIPGLAFDLTHSSSYNLNPLLHTHYHLST